MAGEGKRKSKAQGHRRNADSHWNDVDRLKRQRREYRFAKESRATDGISDARTDAQIHRQSLPRLPAPDIVHHSGQIEKKCKDAPQQVSTTQEAREILPQAISSVPSGTEASSDLPMSVCNMHLTHEDGDSLSSAGFSTVSTVVPSSPSEEEPDPVAVVLRTNQVRKDRLEALAAKHAASDAANQAPLADIDDIDSDLLASEAKNKELVAMVKWSQEEIARLERHLSYRQGKMTDLEQGLQTERNRVTELCKQREQQEVKQIKIMAHVKMMKAIDIEMRKRCRKLEEDLEEAKQIRDIGQSKDLMPERQSGPESDVAMKPVAEGPGCDCPVSILHLLDCQHSLPTVQGTTTASSESAEDTADNVNLQSPKMLAPPGPQSNAKPRARRPIPLEMQDDGRLVTLELSPEPSICTAELKALEQGVYLAATAAERGKRFGELRNEIRARGLENMGRMKMEQILACYA